MKKAILLLLVLSLMTVAAAAATTCKVKCETPEGNFCYPESSACEYKISEGCDASLSLDSDSDGWQDGCDGFLADSTEWIDIDGDGVGHNKDCNDFDSTNTGICSGSSRSSGSSSSQALCVPIWECDEWTECIDGARTRTCDKVNSCEQNYNKPSEWEACPTYVVLNMNTQSQAGDAGDSSEPQVEVVKTGQDSGEEGSEGLTGITGQAFNTGSGAFQPASLLLLLLLAGILLFFFIKRKKSQEE